MSTAPQYNLRYTVDDFKLWEGDWELWNGVPGIEGLQLLPYHDLWRSKLDRFGLKSEFPRSVRPPSRSTMNHWTDYLQTRGVHVVTSS